MKKLLLSLMIAVGFASVSYANTATYTAVVLPNTATNLLSTFNSNAKITYFSLTANSTNTYLTVYDAPTNNWSYTIPSYTNTASYLTNYVQTWTNYFGVTNSWTNLTLVDISNVVASVSATYPARITLAAPAGQSTVINPAAFYFEQGIWATNTGTAAGGIATVTFTIVQ